MIPRAYVTEWRDRAPWPSDEQVEQDLIITRALVELFRRPVIQQALAFRGGTALAKLYLAPAHRYSEDIDLVQIQAGPIGPTLNAMRETRIAGRGSNAKPRQRPSSIIQISLRSTK